MATMLEAVKSMIGVTGDYQDATLTGYIAEVKEYLLGAGVSSETVEAATSAGIIARGVTDLWNYGAGKGELSPYFKERAIQLASKNPGGSSESPAGVSDYNDLTGKPTLNGVTIEGNKKTSDYGIKPKDFIVTFTGFATGSEKTCDKTFQEIKEAYDSGATVMAVTDAAYGFIPVKNINETSVTFDRALNAISYVRLGISNSGAIIVSYVERIAGTASLGVIRADTATESDTIPCRIKENAKLYVTAKQPDFIVNVTGFVTESEKSADKSVAEIYQAWVDGKTVYAVTDDSTYNIMPLVEVSESGASFLLSRGLAEKYLRINSNGVIIISIKEQIASYTTMGGFKSGYTDQLKTSVPIITDMSTGRAYADLEISEKTEADTDYTVEVKIDPITKKLYIPASAVGGA